VQVAGAEYRDPQIAAILTIPEACLGREHFYVRS
jgi:hypothetical protein